MQERELKLMSGWPALAGLFLWLGLIILLMVIAVQNHLAWLAWVIVPLIVLWPISIFGFIVNSPNQSRVVQLMGQYVGTIKDTGFFYGIPLYRRTRVSLRVRTFETGVTKTGEVRDPMTGKMLANATEHRQPSKVNDRDGTPIEIAAVVVWKVANPTEAVFQVDDYEAFVKIQSEAALRNLASTYSYDGHGEERPCAATRPRSAQNSNGNWTNGCTRPAWKSWKPELATWPMLRKSPPPCCSGSKPEP